MRLIDADRLKIFIKEHSYPVRYGTNSVEQGMTLTGISECIDEQPTAYDVNKVIEQLGEASKYYECDCKEDKFGRNCVELIDYLKAIDIVRGDRFDRSCRNSER